MNRSLSFLRKDERFCDLVFVCHSPNSIDATKPKKPKRVLAHAAVFQPHSALIKNLVEISRSKQVGSFCNPVANIDTRLIFTSTNGFQNLFQPLILVVRHHRNQPRRCRRTCCRETCRVPVPRTNNHQQGHGEESARACQATRTRRHSRPFTQLRFFVRKRSCRNFCPSEEISGEKRSKAGQRCQEGVKVLSRVWCKEFPITYNCNQLNLVN